MTQFHQNYRYHAQYLNDTHSKIELWQWLIIRSELMNLILVFIFRASSVVKIPGRIPRWIVERGVEALAEDGRVSGLQLKPRWETTRAQATQQSSELAAEDVEDDEVCSRVDCDEKIGDCSVALDPLNVFVHEDGVEHEADEGLGTGQREENHDTDWNGGGSELTLL